MTLSQPQFRTQPQPYNGRVANEIKGFDPKLDSCFTSIRNKLLLLFHPDTNQLLTPHSTKTEDEQNYRINILQYIIRNKKSSPDLQKKYQLVLEYITSSKQNNTYVDLEEVIKILDSRSNQLSRELQSRIDKCYILITKLLANSDTTAPYVANLRTLSSFLECKILPEQIFHFQKNSLLEQKINILFLELQANLSSFSNFEELTDPQTLQDNLLSLIECLINSDIINITNDDKITLERFIFSSQFTKKIV